MLVSGAVGDQPVRLVLQPGGQYETTYTLSIGPVLQATVRLGGHLDARVRLDRDGGRVEGLQFTGGASQDFCKLKRAGDGTGIGYLRF